MTRRIAHSLDAVWRSEDVDHGDDVTFDQFMLSERVLTGLRKSGFVKPSPIQVQAIPLGLCGFDLVVQAKSGTGKTCVFAVLALEAVDVGTNAVQVLILAPTREIAVQTCDTVRCLGCELPGLHCYAFIGGVPLQQDLQKLASCHIAVATMGRLCQLVRSGQLQLSQVRLLVLDEADQMLGEAFLEDLSDLWGRLPSSKQVVATSATYPPAVARLLEEKYLHQPALVRLGAEDPALLGVSQWYLPVEGAFLAKLSSLESLLRHMPFSQCLVFVNSQARARSLSERLNRSLGGVQLLSGAQGQEERMAALARLKGFRCRLLVSTDLAARGIDAERVNLVVNFDLPWDLETHLHRSGRAGRYGSAGDAVTLVSGAGELEQLQVLCRPIGLLLRPLPATAWSPQSGSAEQNNITNSGTGNIAEHACEATQKPPGERAAQPPQPALGPQLGSVLLDKKAHLGTDLAWPPNRTLCTALWRLVLADRDAFLNTGAVGEAVGPQDAEDLLEEGDLLEKNSSQGRGGPPNEDGHQDRRDRQRKQGFLQEGGLENEYGVHRRDSSCKGHGLQRKCCLQEEPSPHRADTCSQKLCSPLQWPCAVGTFGWPWLWEHSYYMQRMLRPLGDGSNHW